MLQSRGQALAKTKIFQLIISMTCSDGISFQVTLKPFRTEFTNVFCLYEIYYTFFQQRNRKSNLVFSLGEGWEIQPPFENIGGGKKKKKTTKISSLNLF